MRTVEIGDRYQTVYASCLVLVEVVKVIKDSEPYSNNWDFVCLVREVGGEVELLRRVSELRKP